MIILSIKTGQTKKQSYPESMSEDRINVRQDVEFDSRKLETKRMSKKRVRKELSDVWLPEE